ncbi:MAG TPA: VPA1262 family N-terminal domain-containing protein [Stellaceae bacterium]|nr:VPA1262 family N-terminal domain-containing protein [Stellaceae bacterium]
MRSARKSNLIQFDPPNPLPELERLIAPNVLGFYTHVEGTEIFAIRDGEKSAINVFTILVAEERPNDGSQAPERLNPKPIKIKSLKGWTFGMRRYRQPIGELIAALTTLQEGQGWQMAGETLSTGELVPMWSQFVPPDNAPLPVALNRLLKNNFWGGSHVFEWTNREKAALKPLFDDPRRLQALSEEIGKYVPLRLASVSDRLGNLVVQLPITVITAKFHHLRNGEFDVEFAWHPQATPRPLNATCALDYDGVLGGYQWAPMQEPMAKLPMRAGHGVHNGFIWDEERKVLLAATGTGAVINTVVMNMQVADPEPRVFEIKLADGSAEERRVGLIAHSTQNLIGNLDPDDNGGWTAKRMYEEEARRLSEQRRFVQYRPKPGEKNGSRQKALSDLRLLITQYGREGAWLWDPYLNARDVLETLFYCPYQGADLRALTVPHKTTAAAIRGDFENTQSNWRGLRLEFRASRGAGGFEFHDRFLIFPGFEQRAFVWSLGTSVNGVGKAHHILQQVDNGQLVMDAFVDLWERLGAPKHLIWRKP